MSTGSLERLEQFSRKIAMLTPPQYRHWKRRYEELRETMSVAEALDALDKEMAECL